MGVLLNAAREERMKCLASGLAPTNSGPQSSFCSPACRGHGAGSRLEARAGGDVRVFPDALRGHLGWGQPSRAAGSTNARQSRYKRLPDRHFQSRCADTLFVLRLRGRSWL